MKKQSNKNIRKSNYFNNHLLPSQKILNISLESISRRRTELMGIAILWILLFHSQIDFGDSFYLAPFQIIKSIGYGGVDIFFFVSGFGLACGWSNKTYNLLGFYQKRVLRILPIYCFWMVCNGLIQLIVFEEFRLRGFIADFLGVGFLFGKNYNNWFIPALLISYLIFPLIVLYFSRKVVIKIATRGFWIIILSTTILSVALSLILILANANKLLIFSTRLPSFILGTFIGLALVRNNLKTLRDLNCNILTIISILVLGFSGLYIALLTPPEINWFYGLWWYSFIFLAFPLCLVFAALLDRIEREHSGNKIFSCFRNGLYFCGQYSLEIYLVHGLVFQFSPYLQQVSSYCSTDRNTFLEYSILILISIFIAYFLNKSFNSLLLQMKGRYQKI